MAINQKRMLSGTNWTIRADKDNPIVPAGKKMPAQVPGNVQATLEENHYLRPFNYGMGDPNIHEACLTGWWYETEFELDGSEITDNRYTIVFDGVDFQCEIRMNDILCGENKGTFKSFEVDITEQVKAGKNILSVYIYPMPEELLTWVINSDGPQSGAGTGFSFVEGNNQIRKKIKGLKFPANLSYDWGSNVYTLGIWKDVMLKTTASCRLDCLEVLPELNDDFSTAAVKVIAMTDCTAAGKAVLKLHLTGNGADLTQEIPVELTAGKGRFTGEITLENPQLWWVTGYGEQPLYDMEAEFVLEDGTVSDSQTARFGIRDIKWINYLPEYKDFYNPFGLILNGAPVRTMGSNLTATDLLFGRNPERGAYYVETAKRCSMNTLRLHGGQGMSHESVYRAADELGILLILEFPMGNTDPGTDPEISAMLADTCRNIVRKVINHPSIIEIDGGNEMNWCFSQEKNWPARDLLRKISEEENPTRLFRDTCPIDGGRHSPWDYNPDITYRQFNAVIMDNRKIVPTMRYGEFGCQTPANLEVWERDVPLADRWPVKETDPVLTRKNAVEGVFSSEFWLNAPLIERMFGKRKDLRSMIAGGQLLGAEGLRYQMDALRAKGKLMAGFTSWDYNEPWPNGAGSFVIDFDGRPVMAYYFVKQALEPIALQLEYDNILLPMFRDSFAKLRIVSDAPEKAEKLEYSWKMRDCCGEIFNSGSGITEVEPMEVKEMEEIRINAPERMMRGPVFAELTLKDETGKIIAERVHVFSTAGLKAPLAGLLDRNLKIAYYAGPFVTTGIDGTGIKSTELKVSGTSRFSQNGKEYFAIELENTGDMTALFAEVHPLTEYRTDLFVDGNFVSIPPAEKRTVTICSWSGDRVDAGYRVTCFNADDLIVEPGENILLYLGRKTSACCEFKGYAQSDAAQAKQPVQAQGRMIPASEVPYALTESIEFALDEKWEADAVLELHVCDTAREGAAVRVEIGEFSAQAVLAGGLGEQLAKADAACYPASYSLKIPRKAIGNAGILKITAESGWFTWDALLMKEE